jgi:hypothetical protein
MVVGAVGAMDEVSARQSLDAGHRWCRGARNRQRIDPRSAGAT